MSAFREIFWRMFLIPGAWYFVARMDHTIVPMVWNGMVFETRLQVVDHDTIWRVMNRLPTEYKIYDAVKPDAPIFSPRLATYSRKHS